MWKKFYVVLALLFLASLPLFSESNEVLEPETEIELTVPELEPEAEYVMMGQDIMTLYQTVIDLNETKNEWENLTDEMMGILKDAQALCHEYANENEKLQLQNDFLVGGITVSVGVVVVGAIVWAFTK